MDMNLEFSDADQIDRAIVLARLSVKHFLRFLGSHT